MRTHALLTALLSLLSGCLGSSGGGVAGSSRPDGGATDVPQLSSLQIRPVTLSVEVGKTAALTATAVFEDGSTEDVTQRATWSASPPGRLEIETSETAPLALVTGLASGSAKVAAEWGGVPSAGSAVTVWQGTPPMPIEARALWVTRFAFSTRQGVEALIAQAAAAGFNVIYFQIRGAGDAYYRSDLVPWARGLSGTLGKDPGWDPLQVAIDAAHARGIQLHAYFNAFSAWPVPAGCKDNNTCRCTAQTCQLPPASAVGAPEHFLRAHPQTLAVTAGGESIDEEYYWFSPGSPTVRGHLVAVAEELLTRYAVDGLHLDRVRYPGSVYSHDPDSVAAYAAISGTKPSYPDWQRAQVTDLVDRVYAVVKRVRPKAVLSAAVWGIYKRLPGCTTSQGYVDYFQDSIGWVRSGKIDWISPMTYWGIGTGCTDWAKLVDGFIAGAGPERVVAGMHALESGSTAPQMAMISGRIEHARGAGASGTAIYASSYFKTESQWAEFRTSTGPYQVDAGVPPLSWR